MSRVQGRPGDTSLEYPRGAVGNTSDWPLEAGSIRDVADPALEQPLTSIEPTMILALVLAQLASAPGRPTDSLYSSTQDSIDREVIRGAVQEASSVQWKNHAFKVKVLAARPAVSLEQRTMFPGLGWLMPALYGDRLPFIFVQYIDSADTKFGPQRMKVDTLAIDHPFGFDRERRYRFSGGDTSATIHARDRTIPIIHIHVVPVLGPGEAGTAFEGDVYLDAASHQIARMRGRFAWQPKRGSAEDRTRRATATTIASYIDVTNEEVGGAIWLPHSERIETQTASFVFHGERSIMRFTATFSGHAIDTAASAVSAPPAINSRPTVTRASTDSLALPHRWSAPRGAASAAVQATDFDDVAPANWRDTGPAHFSMAPSRMSRLIHFDPVEGYYTGLEGTENFRDLAPGLSVRAFAGWAWAEHTARGGVAVTSRRGGRVVGVHAERSLESTNDFVRDPSISDPGFAEFLGFIRRRDYVDRKSAALSVSDIRHSFGDAIASVQLGVGRDGAEQGRLAQFPMPLRRFVRDSLPPNRLALDGDYARLALDYEFHPNQTVAATTSGVGMRVHYEVASGQLAWQRATIGLSHHKDFDGLWIGERFDAGIVTSARTMPPQQLFELGGTDRLQSYEYKQFAGDRAAIGSAGFNYAFPALRSLRLPTRHQSLPPLAPGIGAGIEFGWATLSSDGARAAAQAMSDPTNGMPASVSTNGLRGSGGAGFTLFSGLLHFGVAHSFDSGAQWRAVAGVGTMY